MASVLDGLPEELLIQIAEHLQGEDAALRSLALANRRLQAIAEPVLYRSIFFRTGEQLARLKQALESESVPWRIRGIRIIDARCIRNSSTNDASALNELGHILMAAPNVEELTMESPFCNNNSWRQATDESGWSSTMGHWLSPFLAIARFDDGCLMAIPPQQPAQGLKKLTLHLNGVGREFWTMEGVLAGILAHPTLEELHMSSINIIDYATADLSLNSRTLLKRLILDEANVTLDGLRGVLSIPKALKYLYIGENRYSPREQRFPRSQKYNRLATRDANAFVEVLALQKHSLEALVYVCNEAYLNPPNFQPQETPDVDLTGFEVLRELSMTGCSHNNMLSWSTSCKAPPLLQQLTVDELIYIDVVIESGLPVKPPMFIKDIAATVPQLKQLNIVGARNDFDLNTPWMKRSRDATAIAGALLRERNCVLHVSRPPTETKIVRPVLYGELEPDNVVMYVNDEQGFRVFVNFDDWLPPDLDDTYNELPEFGIPEDELVPIGMDTSDEDEEEEEDDEDEDEDDWEDADDEDENEEDSEHGLDA